MIFNCIYCGAQLSSAQRFELHKASYCPVTPYMREMLNKMTREINTLKDKLNKLEDEISKSKICEPKICESNINEDEFVDIDDSDYASIVL